MPYPTATIFAPWHALTDTDGVIDPARLPANVALTDAPETFDANLDVNGDLYCGDDLGVVGDIAAGGTVTVGGSVVTAAGVYEHGRSTPLGEWQDVAFNAANFTSNAGTWTVAGAGVTVNRYTLVGKTVFWTIQINAATLAGAGIYLLIACPVTMTIAHPVHCAFATDGAGTHTPAFIVGLSGGSLAIRQQSAAAWANGALNYVYLTAIGEVS